MQSIFIIVLYACYVARVGRSRPLDALLHKLQQQHQQQRQAVALIRHQTHIEQLAAAHRAAASAVERANAAVVAHAVQSQNLAEAAVRQRNEQRVSARGSYMQSKPCMYPSCNGSPPLEFPFKQSQVVCLSLFRSALLRQFVAQCLLMAVIL